MPHHRPKLDLDSYRDLITHWHQLGESDRVILGRLSQTYRLKCSRATLQRRYVSWGLKKQQHTLNTPQLQAQIQELFFTGTLSDSEIHKALHMQDETVTLTAIIRIRRSLNLWRRNDNDRSLIATEAVRQHIQNDFQYSTLMKTYGRGLLYTYLRQNYLTCARDSAYEVLREFHTEDLSHRFGRGRSERRDFEVPGPDHTWSVDGYDKLKRFGFEIYAGIDAYSRFITWFYIGISNATATSIAHQYLILLKEKKTMPQRIRSDHGGETGLLAAIHFYLLGNRTKVLNGVEIPITFQDIYIFGRSVHNTRIESWWAQLSESCLKEYRDFFESLSKAELFHETVLADRIALLFIYMPKLRDLLAKHVHTWNCHRIRKQGAHVQSGKPISLYHQLHTPENAPDLNASVPIHQERFQSAVNLLQPSEEYLDKFLPDEITELCQSFNIEISERARIPEQPFIEEYLLLRQRLGEAQNTGTQLFLLKKPTEGTSRIKEVLEDLELSIE